ncbi:helix-turn-helix domain-containing protein [Desulfomonile tiedjei]|uniref:Helix-turn-helix domain-containing protein n=1 Tax=Desulfomonile tiedjei (strain ATCC 49306 / DSM 6799 / DCB-1) TaxID=706587 RepID=I4CF92_DESTA|nr:helix-turn-helix domain-containing protein [Desulfomonile tiedjei]AFM28233.1 hypothetical protein Desti_5654 [Desulfomonile tiedjei DSM 6799]
MSRISQCISSPIDSSIPFSILDLKAQAVRLPVSKGAQILLSELLTWSGERGYCWWSKEAIAKDLKWSSSSVWRRTAELQEAGFLASIPRPGRSNYWVPLPGPAKMARLENELTPVADSRYPLEKKIEKTQKRCTVHQPSTGTEQLPPSPLPANDNASKISELESRITKLEQTLPTPRSKAPIPENVVHSSNPQRSSSSAPLKPNLSPEDRLLLQDIEETCHDFHSRGCFINIIREYPEETIRAALSVTRETLATVSGTNGGAYFLATLRGMAAVCAAEDSPQPKTHPSHWSESEVIRPVAPCVQPRERTPATGMSGQAATSPPLPEPEQPDPAALIKGWRLLYEPGNVQRMLSGIKRCFSQCDVHKIWENLKGEMIHLTEEGLVSEFLDLMAMKVCYGTPT